MQHEPIIGRYFTVDIDGSAHRIFVALATKEETRIHTFAERESRDVDPLVLQAQLDGSNAL